MPTLIHNITHNIVTRVKIDGLINNVGLALYNNFFVDLGVNKITTSFIVFCHFLIPFYLLGTSELQHLSYDQLDSMAVKFYQESNYEYCIEIIKEGCRKSKLQFGKDSTYANYLGDLAFFYKKTGEYFRAERIYREALLLKEKTIGKHHLSYSETLNNLAVLCRNMGRYDEAEQLNFEAIAIQKEIVGVNHKSYALSLNNLAVLYKETGKYNQAKTLYVKSLKIFKQTLGTQNSTYATLLGNIGLLHHYMKEFKQSEQYISKSLEIVKENLGENHYAYARTLNNLGALYVEIGKLNEAILLFKNSIRIYEENRFSNDSYYMRCINNLANAYQDIGAFKQSEETLLKVIRILNKLYEKSHPYYVRAFNNLIDLYRSMGYNNKAWQTTIKTLEILTDKPIKVIDEAQLEQLKTFHYPTIRHIQETVRCLTFMFDLLSKDKSNISLQKSVCELAIFLLKKNRDQYISKKDKLRLLEESHSWMLKSLNVLNLEKEFNQAYQNVAFHKSVLLLEATKASKAYQLGNLPDSIAFKELYLQKQQDELQAKMFSQKSPKKRDSLLTLYNILTLEIAQFKKEMESPL